MQQPNIKDILERYQSGNSTEEEREWVENWYLNWKTGDLDLSEQGLYEDLAMVKKQLPTRSNSTIFYRVAAVAAMLAFAFSTAFYFYKQTAQQPQVTYSKITHGSNKAILTLSDGSTVVLDTTSDLTAIDQQGVIITKDASGKLVYTSTKTGKVVDAYNMVSTPKGGQYDIVLPDGTKVWLNAASKLRFPIVFGGTERRVELNGEAYFEVAKDKTKPFKVQSDQQEIIVLGTHFNVNCYNDEPQVRTTLLEGSILLKGKNEVVLKPGQQARMGTAENFRVVDVDVQTEVAWKNNLFYFENESIKSIMRQVSRWYDVEVIYHDDVVDKKVWGSITRFSEISKVLDIIELTGNIHFKVVGRRIIVMK